MTSEEYHANQASVFILVDGEYYGCLIYPKHCGFPKDADYWRTAESSDKGRHFMVEEVVASVDDIEFVKRKHASIDVNRSKLKGYTGYRPFATKQERELDYLSDLETEKYNRPIDREIIRDSNELREFILGLENVKQE